MNLSRKTLQKLGFQKISLSEFPFESIVQLNTEYADISTKSWGVSVQSVFSSRCDYLKKLIILSDCSGDESSNRKFYNHWKLIWNRYSLFTDLNSDSTEKILSDVGLRLLSVEYDSSLDRVFQFYDSIVYLYILTSLDCNESKLLESLVLMGVEEFTEYIRKEVDSLLC